MQNNMIICKSRFQKAMRQWTLKSKQYKGNSEIQLYGIMITLGIVISHVAKAMPAQTRCI